MAFKYRVGLQGRMLHTVGYGGEDVKEWGRQGRAVVQDAWPCKGTDTASQKPLWMKQHEVTDRVELILTSRSPASGPVSDTKSMNKYRARHHISVGAHPRVKPKRQRNHRDMNIKCFLCAHHIR